MHETRPRLHALTSLRFVAAAMIVLFHSQGHFGIPADQFSLVALGLGVPFFFVLSGFILTYTYPWLGGEQTYQFLVARFARLWPAHVATFLLIFVLLPPDRRSAVYGYTVPAALANLTLVHAWLPYWDSFFSFNAVSWSISTELGFYLLFPLLIRNWARTWHVKLALSLATLIGVVTTCNLLDLPHAAWDRPGASIEGLVIISPLGNLMLFVLGMATCLAWQHWARPVSMGGLAATLLEAVALVLAVAAVGIASPVAEAGHATAPWIGSAGAMRLELGGLAWVAFPLLIATMASERGLLSRLLALPAFVLLGEISYATYLLHQIVLRWTDYRADLLEGMPNALQIALFWICTLVGAWLLWRYVERPSRRALIRWLAPAEHRSWRLTAIAAPSAVATVLALAIWLLRPSVGTVVAAAGLGDGAFIVVQGSPQLYLVEGGRKRAFQTWESFLAHGGKPDGGNVHTLTEREFGEIPFGLPVSRE